MHGTMGMARADDTQESLSVADVEDRILRSCKTLRALPDRERRFQVLANVWPEILQDAEEAYGYTEAIMPRFRPSPSDVSDCLTALAWARAIPKKAFRFIWWRSFGLSFGMMGDIIGRSDELARQRYRTALVDIWYEAKRQEAAEHLTRLGKFGITGLQIRDDG